MLFYIGLSLYRQLNIIDDVVCNTARFRFYSENKMVPGGVHRSNSRKYSEFSVVVQYMSLRFQRLHQQFMKREAVKIWKTLAPRGYIWILKRMN